MLEDSDKMPASEDKNFYEMLNSVAKNKDEDAVQQNKRIKEAQFAEDNTEPNEEQTEAIRKAVEAGKHKVTNQPHRS